MVDESSGFQGEGRWGCMQMDLLPNDLVTIQFIERREMPLNEWARKLDSNIFPVYIKYNKSDLPLSRHHEVHGCSSKKDPTARRCRKQ